MEEASSLKNLSFMVVDDNIHMRQLLRMILKALEAGRVVDASDGADALKKMGTNPVDVLLVDWEMSPLDGMDLVRMLRTGSDSPNPYVPIIMLSAHSEMTRVQQARDAGVNEFLVKPVSAKGIYQRVISIISTPRPFIRSKTYFGPDRRRRQSAHYKGPERRKSMQEKAAAT